MNGRNDVGNARTGHVKSRRANSTPGVQTRRRPAEVRQRLIEAAERVVIEKGLAATAQDIAAEADIHRTVLRRHFPDTGELIREAVLRPFREFLAVFQAGAEREQPGTAQPTWDFTRDLVAELAANFYGHRGFLTRVMADPSVLGNTDLASVHQTLDALIDNMASVGEGLNSRRGLDTKALPVRTRLALAMIAGITTHGDWFLPQGDHALSEDQIIDEICDFVLYGLRLVPADVKARDRRPLD
jgi:AcrR family transcriptional regulator